MDFYCYMQAYDDDDVKILYSWSCIHCWRLMLYSFQLVLCAYNIALSHLTVCGLWCVTHASLISLPIHFGTTPYRPIAFAMQPEGIVVLHTWPTQKGMRPTSSSSTDTFDCCRLSTVVYDVKLNGNMYIAYSVNIPLTCANKAQWPRVKRIIWIGICLFAKKQTTQ